MIDYNKKNKTITANKNKNKNVTIKCTRIKNLEKKNEQNQVKLNFIPKIKRKINFKKRINLTKKKKKK